MLLNTLILQITEQSSISLLVDKLNHDGYTSFHLLMSKNLLKEQFFYLQFIIHMSLVTNSTQLLDIPHKAMLFI